LRRFITTASTGSRNFVVGRVETCEQHPDADRLKVCTVDVGDGAPSQIVCGAPNVAAGQTVGVAKPGSVHARRDQAQEGKTPRRRVQRDDPGRGRSRIGMDHAGTMELDTKAKPGSPLADVIPISTEVIEFEITPEQARLPRRSTASRARFTRRRRPNSRPSRGPMIRAPTGPLKGIDVKIEAPDLCPRFTARIFENVKIGPSPRWLKARLIGGRNAAINNVVDITNYTMWITGQPLHAFDLDRVAGGKLVSARQAGREGRHARTARPHATAMSRALSQRGEGPIFTFSKMRAVNAGKGRALDLYVDALQRTGRARIIGPRLGRSLASDAA